MRRQVYTVCAPVDSSFQWDFFFHLPVLLEPDQLPLKLLNTNTLAVPTKQKIKQKAEANV